MVQDLNMGISDIANRFQNEKNNNNNGKMSFYILVLNLDILFYICFLENRYPYFSQRQESEIDLKDKKKQKKKTIEHVNQHSQ